MQKDLDSIDWEDLLTKPLNDQELGQFQSLFAGDAFEEMVRSYHMNSALDTLRQIILNYFSQGAWIEAMVTALENVWLDCVARCVPGFEPEIQENWREQPLLLAQVLLQHAMETMADNKKNVKLTFSPELEEMYQKWLEKAPVRLEKLDENDRETIQTLSEHTIFLYDALTQIRNSVESKGLKLDATDYIEIWTMLLLQTYLLKHPDLPEFFLVLDTNWNIFLEHLTDLINLMTLMSGMEKLLLPENQNLLQSYIQSDGFQERLVKNMMG